MAEAARSSEILAAKRRRLLELLARADDASAAESIERRPPAEPPVLSYGQQRLWFIEQLQPGSAAYHVPGAVRIRGPLDTAVLARCLREIVRRHEILRTGVSVAGGQPAAAIAPPEAATELPLITADVSALPANRREAQIHRLIGAYLRRPFDFTRPPLARTVLLRLGAEESIFLLLMHHLISDVWSIGVFFRNTMAMYDAFTAGRPSPLPSLPVQYADYARWQQRRLEGEALEKLLGYWKGQLAGVPQVLELPVDHPRPPVQTFRGGQAYFSLGAELTDALRALGTRHQATLYMTLLAAFNALLYRVTFQPTILVGIPIANRNRVELEGLIGLLLNTLVVRIDLAGGEGFLPLLAQTRERSLAGFAHQDLPFERLVEELKIERDMSRSPVFQVMFTFQNVPPSAMDTRDLALSRYEVLEGTSREDLELNLRDTGEGLAGWFAYDLGLFDAATPARLAGHLLALLRGAVAHPEAPLAELPLLSEAEAQALLQEWNDTAVTGPARQASFSELFAAQAARTPAAIAALCEGEALTYTELAGRARHLARRVRALPPLAPRPSLPHLPPPPPPPPIIAVLARRGLDLLVALAGLLEAGAVYLPLDPEQPAGRQAQMLRESGALAVLAGDEQLPALAAALDALAPEQRPRVHSLAELAGSGGEEDAAIAERVAAGSVEPRHAAAGDRAYMIFTSGSTGVPKGVLVEHGGMLNHLYAKIETLSLGADDVVAQTASQCFDISIWQFLAPLLVGGRTLIVPDAVAHDPELLAVHCGEDGVTILETVPSLLRLILEAVERRGGSRPAFSALRWLVPTGEALPPELCSRWLAAFPAVPLLNAYGPTECSDDVTHHPIARLPAAAAARVPLGRAVRNIRLYVLDPWGRPAPIGVAGELCVGGAGVGQGYHGAAAKTAAAFVPDPFAGAALGARLYRTGDLVRRLADGNLDFLGRIDHQVKVRGFRIELGEIEAVLAEHPALSQAVVLAQEAGAAERALVAYVVAAEPARQDQAAFERELRELLGARLPDYMVPAAFVPLDAMPLTANGKVDRRALAAHGGADFASRASYVAPRTPVEESLAAIWAEVLKLPRVGANDNFFDVGGQSLLATQVVSRIREAFAVELPVRSLFQQPDLAGLARAVEAEMRRGRGLPMAPPMTRVPRDGELPLSFAQERLWFIDQVRPGLAAYNIFGAARMRGRLDVAVLERSFSELARRHEVLRTTFAAVDGRPLQRVGPPWRVPIPVVDLRSLPAAARHSWALRMINEEAERAFDLGRGPLIRGVLLRLEDDYQLLAVTAHHIVYDIWSREILIRELGALYEAFWHGRPSPLPELPVQYADFASWQRQWLQGEALAAQLEYWERQLAGITTGTELAGDRPRPPVHRFRGTRVFAALPAEQSAELAAFSRRHGATTYMALLAGFAALLHRYTGEEDVVVGSPIANRNRAEIEGLIGFFVNTQVLRTSLAGSPTFGELLARAREVALAAYSNQDLAFEQLVRVLKPPRDPARQPLFQVLFNFLTNYKPVVMELPGLTLSPEPNHSGAVQFDLIVSMYEADARLNITADFSTDLFDRPTIVRLLAHFANLLASGAADPGQAAADLALWPPAERQQVLLEWNDSAAPGSAEPPPDERRFDQIFAAQAARTPGAVAAICGGEELTYGELERRANRLARRLLELGVGPERLVALLGERGLDFLTAVLAVFKAGGAYLPLDARHPPARLRQVLRQSGADLVLTTGAAIVREQAEEALAPAPEEEGAAAPRLRSIGELLGGAGDAEEPKDGPAPRSGAAELAYVIYTSGSTGVPKGAMLVHRGMWNHLAAKIELLGLTARDVVAQTAAQTFDISVWQMLAALAVGGRVHIFGDEIAHDPPRLFSEVARSGVTVFETVPSLLQLMLGQAAGEPGAGSPPCALRWLLLTGEALPPAHCRRWFETYPEVPVVNAYGPTECSDDVTHQVLRRAPGGGAVRTPIGRAVRNTRLYLLDRGLRPAPVGVPGELYAGGAGVGRGYLGDPLRTAEVFLPDPFGASPGGRLYRTMDLARRLPGGELEFLGRVDHQVKVRGSRIELGEIESALLRHPRVVEAVVLLKTAAAHAGGASAAAGEERGALADQRLVAFVVAAPELLVDQAQLRAFLGQTLPDSMLPAAFVVLEALPLTANGKVDRAALDALDVSELIPRTPFVAPRNALEERLAAILTQLLGVERVGAHDNFFDLGGHSLLTTQLMSRLRAAFGLEVPLATFFDDPTMAGLAQAIELARLFKEASPEVPVGVELEVGEL